MRPVRELLVFHGLYGLAALLLLGFAPAGYYGLTVSGLVVGYHVALVGTALAGGGPGLSAILLIDDGLAVIVLANHDEPGAEQVGTRLLEALR